MGHMHSFLLAQSYNVKKVSSTLQGLVLSWSLEKITPIAPEGSVEDSTSITGKKLVQEGALVILRVLITFGFLP